MTTGGFRKGAEPDKASPDLKALLSPQKSRKYRNVPQTVDGIHFDSTKEAMRYVELQRMASVGEIRSLEVHPRFPLVIHGIDCGTYEGDFAYVTRDGVPVVEDVKSAATRKLPTYRKNRRLVWALYAVEIREV